MRTRRVPGRRSGEAGFALSLVLVTFLLISLIGLGVFSVVMSDIQGSVANQLAMEVLNVAEAGADYAIGQLYAGALANPTTDEGYTGSATPVAFGRGSFVVTVECAEGTVPPACADPDLRHIVSTGTYAPLGTLRARRQIELWVRRSTPSGSITGLCGRDGVELDQGTSIAADVASNRDVDVEGPRRNPGSIRARSTLTTAPTTFGTAVGVAPAAPPPPAGLNGQYTWKVSYVFRYPGSTTAEIESLAGPPSTAITLINEHGKLTSLPEDNQALRRRIYRTLADQPSGPWYLVAEIPANNSSLADVDPDPAVVEYGYIDSKADAELSTLGIQDPAPILGNASAGDDVNCSQGCPNQVDGVVTENARDVLCPAFLPPPCSANPSNGPPPAVLSYTDAPNCTDGFCYGDLTLAAYGVMTINTHPTDPDPTYDVHVHVSSVDLGRDSIVAITGVGKVYVHVTGSFHLGQRSWFGVTGAGANAPLVWPADRVQLLSCANDSAYLQGGPTSVQWDQQNRVAALVFAPNANILINQAGEFNGSLYGRYIHINQATGFIVDQGRGFDEDLLKAAFQYVQRWYDDPRP